MKTIRNVAVAAGLWSAATIGFGQTNTFPSSGSVGIGTMSPDRALQVTGSIASRGTTTTHGYVALDPGNSSFAGYIEWYKAGGTRLGYLGYLDLAGGQGNLGLNLENAANFVVGGGNVGIGTASPNMALHVKGGNVIARFESTAASSLVYFSPTGWDEYRIGAGVVNVNDWGVQNMTRSTTPFVITGGASGGNVGIGTATPSNRLQVAGGGNGTVDFAVNGRMQTGDVNGNGGIWLNSAQTAFIGTEGNDRIGIYTSNGWAISVPQNGNVGIGTTTPSHKLAVNGTIRAKEVIVDTGWSDYVFDDGYKLPALSEVEQRIKAEHHLPGIPSAREVAEHGVSMGEMQSMLLARIEELTLHQIEQEKQLKQQQEQLRMISRENEQLLSRLNR